MALEHLTLVFEADPKALSSGEKVLLLAYANYTDAHGYCWPGLDRLMLMTGLSKSAVIRNRKSLEDKNLLRHQRRTTKDGRSTTNLYRINLARLAQLRVAAKFDDNVMALEFADDPEPTQETGPDQAMYQNDTPGFRGDTLGGVDMTPRGCRNDTQSLIDPLQDPADNARTSASDAAAPAEPACLPGNDHPEPAAAVDPMLSRAVGVLAAVEDKLVAEAVLPGGFEPGFVDRYAPEVVQRLAGGWSSDRLVALLTVACIGPKVTNPPGLLVRVLRDLDPTRPETETVPPVRPVAGTPIPPAASVVLAGYGRGTSTQTHRQQCVADWRSMSK